MEGITKGKRCNLLGEAGKKEGDMVRILETRDKGV